VINHKVKSGETLYMIAHANHTTIDEVIKFNNLKRDEGLQVGKTLVVPQDTYFPNTKDKKKTASLSKKIDTQKKETKKTKIAVKKTAKKSNKQKTVLHTVKAGETLYTVAHASHTTIDEVLAANKLSRDTVLKPGQKLTVPQNTYFPEKTKITKKRTKKVSKKVAVKKTKNKKRVVKRRRGDNPLYVVDDIYFKKTGKKRYKKIRSAKTSRKSLNIRKLAKKKLGRRYVWGATGKRNTFDCSGLTTYVFKKNGINLPRRAIAQSRVGKRISRRNLKVGDLIFFDTSKRRKGYVNHVGIYIGNNKFIHASSAKKKVVITSLSKPFYSSRFKGARRPL
jgi:cell wall-associated NlpC family hydrolase